MRKDPSQQSCPFSRRPYVPEANTFFLPFYQRLAVVAGRCLDWFCMNPDTHTHTPGSRPRLLFEPRPSGTLCGITIFCVTPTPNMLMCNHHPLLLTSQHSSLQEDRLIRELCFAAECVRLLIILLMYVCRFSFC